MNQQNIHRIGENETRNISVRFLNWQITQAWKVFIFLVRLLKSGWSKSSSSISSLPTSSSLRNSAKWSPAWGLSRARTGDRKINSISKLLCESEIILNTLLIQYAVLLFDLLDVLLVFTDLSPHRLYAFGGFLQYLSSTRL